MFSKIGTSVLSKIVLDAKNPASRNGAMPDIPCLISRGSKVKGRLISPSEIQLDGTVEGDVHSNRVIISESGFVEGRVYASEITMKGKLVGNIYTKRIHLTAKSHVEGDVHYEELSIETGAFIDGGCRNEPFKDKVMLKTPQASAEKKEAKNAAAAAPTDAEEAGAGDAGATAPFPQRTPAAVKSRAQNATEERRPESARARA